MADVLVEIMPVRERSAARMHTIVYASDEERPSTDPISRFNVYEVDEYIDMSGRLVLASDAPVSLNVSVSIATEADISAIVQPWTPSEFKYQYRPTSRWVADEDHVEESNGLVEKWHSVDGSEMARPWYRLTGTVTELHSENVQVPQYSYKSGGRWVISNAVSIAASSVMRLEIDDVPGGSALMIIGTFDKADSTGYRLCALSFGLDELWFGVDADDTCAVHLNDDLLVSLPFVYGPGRLTGVLMYDSFDGVTAVIRTIDGVQRAATSRGVISADIGPSQASLYGTGSGDSEFVEAALWLSTPSLTLLKQQLLSSMAYYATRTP